MPTMEEVAKQPLEQRLGRLSRMADDLTAAISGRNEVALTRRPDGKNWAANEIICRLRDIEEVHFVRFRTMLSNDDPVGAPRSSLFQLAARGREGRDRTRARSTRRIRQPHVEAGPVGRARLLLRKSAGALP